MKSEHFETLLLDGPNGAAVEVPFDPATRWAIPATRLLPGHHGHRVQGRLNGIAFESAIVSRARGFFLPISDELKATAGVTIGDSVQMIVQPYPATGDLLRPRSSGGSTRRRARRPTT
jgi:hypothetical protein